MNDPVVIVGAGLSGLTAAKILRRSGVETLILESSDAVGGRARTDVVKASSLIADFKCFSQPILKQRSISIIPV